MNNTGTGWWDYSWVLPLGIVGAALGYGVYRKLKKTQTQPPPPPSSAYAQGYAHVNDLNGTATF